MFALDGSIYALGYDLQSRNLIKIPRIVQLYVKSKINFLFQKLIWTPKENIE